MSNGWTTKVATIPAVNPAVDSIREDDRLLVLPLIGGTTLGMLNRMVSAYPHAAIEKVLRQQRRWETIMEKQFVVDVEQALDRIDFCRLKLDRRDDHHLNKGVGGLHSAQHSASTITYIFLNSNI